MLHILSAQAYKKDERTLQKQYQNFLEAEQKKIRELKENIIYQCDYACGKSECEALGLYLHFLDDVNTLSALSAYYDELSRETTEDLIG